MNESEIASMLAKNIHREEHVESPIEEPSVQDDAFKYNMEIEPAQTQYVADYFGLDTIARRTESNIISIREIYRWAANIAKSQEPADVMETIRKVEMEIGTIHKPDRLNKLARFVHLHNQSRVIRAQMGEFYGYAS